jgi:hypothetical protein
MTITISPFGGSTAIGSIGGITFQRHPAGNLVKTKTVPFNPSTTTQQEVRAVWSAILDRWRDVLTNGQREAWQQYAEGAQTRGRRRYPHYITGRQAYIRANYMLGRAALPYVDAPPTTPGIEQPNVFTMSSDSTDGLRILTITPALTATEILQTQRSIEYFQTRNYFKGPFLDCRYFTSADPLPIVLMPGIIINFPFRTWTRLVTLDTANGRLSPAIIIQNDSFA